MSYRAVIEMPFFNYQDIKPGQMIEVRNPEPAMLSSSLTVYRMFSRVCVCVFAGHGAEPGKVRHARQNLRPH